jgi:hypothetical protein
MTGKRPRDPDESLHDEVDRLLKKLPSNNPGAAETGVTAGAVPPKPIIPRLAVPQGPTGQQRLGVWVRAALGLALGALITQWPYPNDCGLPLYLYLAAITTVPVTGVWVALTSWYRRMGLAHLVALGLVLWGLALIAHQVLPRVGYAAVRATWQC